MSVNKKVKGLIKIVGIPAAFVAAGVSVLTLLNMYHCHNVSYEIEGKKVFQKADGVLGMTQVTLNEDGSRNVWRYSFLRGSNFYTDKDGDGYVDRINKIPPVTKRGGHSRVFEGDTQLEKYPQIRHTANSDFRKQIKRFKPFINRMSAKPF